MAPSYANPGCRQKAYASSGAENSVNRGDIDFADTGFAHRWGPITRVVTALTADGPEGHLIVPAGLSSHSDSPYYNTMTELWAEGTYVPVSFTVDEAEASAVEIVTLTP